MYSTAAKDAALDALWGDSHGPTMPATFDLALIEGDPRQVTPVEANYPGYARLAACPNSNVFWDDAVDGVKLSKVQTFPASTGASTVSPDFWAIYVAGALFDFGRLAEPISVTGAGDGPAIRIRRTFNSGLV